MAAHAFWKPSLYISLTKDCVSIEITFSWNMSLHIFMMRNHPAFKTTMFLEPFSSYFPEPIFRLFFFWNPSLYIFLPLSGELRMQKLKSHLVRMHSLNVLPL